MNNATDRPAIESGSIYTRQQVQNNLHLAKETMTLWVLKGLPIYQPGTKSMYFLGSEIIAFIVKNPTLKDKPKTAKERNLLRDEYEQKKAGRSSPTVVNLNTL